MEKIRRSSDLAVRFFLLLAIYGLAVGCQSGVCRELEKNQGPHRPSNDLVKPPAPAAASEVRKNSKVPTVQVYKPDGSLQCDVSRGTPLEDMMRELEGVKVFSKVRKSDGLVHIQACGSPTGMMNVFEIPEEQLSVAENRGFFLWDF